MKKELYICYDYRRIITKTMFSRNNYMQRNLPHLDIFDGILTFMFLIAAGNFIVYLGSEGETGVVQEFSNNTLNISTIKKVPAMTFWTLVTITIIESCFSIAKIIFCLLYTGTNKDYESIRNYVLCGPVLITFPFLCWSLYVFISQINKDVKGLTYLLSYIILSFSRGLNLYVNKT